MPAENTPTVVIFRDPNDLSSALAFANGAVLPDRVQLVSFTIERTTDPVTFTTGNIQPKGDGAYVDIISLGRPVGSKPIGPALFRRRDFFP